MAGATKAWTRQYERFTQRGFLMRVYRNMLSRVLGIQKREAQYYQGLPILPKNVFYMWAVGDAEFQRLWTIWQASNLDCKLTPSIDRPDVTQGYVLDNMQWLPNSVNSGKLTRRDNTTRLRGEAWHKVHNR